MVHSMSLCRALFCKQISAALVARLTFQNPVIEPYVFIDVALDILREQ